MRGIFSNWRKQNLSKATLGKYFLYAIGEIFLITIGVLIAVKINQNQEHKRHSALRCQYLEELKYTFDYDIKDVKENISGIERWNPKITELIDAIQNNRLSEVDSLYKKFGTVGNFIFFGQRSKTKIEELKYSSVDLIGNRELRNKILFYQDGKIMFLMGIERRYNLVDEQVRLYYSKNFLGYHYGNAVPYNMDVIEQDNQFLSLLFQKADYNGRLKYAYQQILKEQKEIKPLIEQEIANNCN